MPSSSVSRAPTARSRSAIFARNSLLTVALGLFAGAAALAVKPPAAAPAVYQARTALPLPAVITPLSGHNEDQTYVTETRIRRGDTLAAILARLQVNAPNLQNFLTYDKNARSIYKLYPGRVVSAGLDANNQLQWLRYHHTPSDTQDGQPVARWLEVTPSAQGFQARETFAKAEVHTQVAEATIRSSLFGATDAAGIPDGIASQIPDILGSKVDFLKDLRSGDHVRVIYESYYNNGQRVGAGRILALEYESQGHVHEALLFRDPNKPNSLGSYYDADGNSLKGAFLRSALKFTRISSTFGHRKHPVHGQWRSHNGVDYAAPTGTAIHATADGVIEFIGSQRGYGNVIILKHNNKISTLYAHQSRFASGLRKGDRVEQGQLIGHVGSTGWATGPHLHYEFRVNGKPMDPLAADLPVVQPLEPKQLQAFKAQAGQYHTHLAMLRTFQQDAQLAQADTPIQP